MPFFGGRPNTEKLKNRCDVKSLARVLGHEKDPQIRRSVSKSVGQIGENQAVEPLVAALNDNSPEVRNAAETELIRMGTVAIQPLVAELESSQCWRVASVLGKIGDSQAVEPLISALQNEDVKGPTIEALGDIGDIRALEPLIAALDDAEEYVRRHAAQALGKIGDKRAVESLITVLKDHDDGVCIAAVEALGKIGDLRAAQPLVDMIEGTLSRGISPFIAKALWQLGDARAADAFINILLERQEYIGMNSSSWYSGEIEMSADHAQYAAEILGEIGDARAVDPLIASLKDVPSVAAAAEKALVQVGKEALDPLIAALQNGSLSVRRRAASALGQIGDTRAVKPLVDLLGVDGAMKDTDELLKHMKKTGQLPEGWENAKPSIELEPSVACAVVRSLGMLGNSHSVKALEFIRNTTSYDDMRQVVAAEALSHLKETG